MTHKKVWIDGLGGPVECIGCDRDGRTVALGHGNHVSLADQMTICGYSLLEFQPDLMILFASFVEESRKNS